MSASSRVITLLTDFGVDDTYVAQMKGVIVGICPSATVIDMTHSVRPQQVLQGAFLLETAIDAFPNETVHVAVVDPGVGTSRRCLAVRVQHDNHERFFVGPDNGLLSCALPPGQRPAEPASVVPPSLVEVVSLEVPPDRPVSATFHGRDVFAVAAARLASGTPIERLGSRADRMIVLPPFRAQEGAYAMLLGHAVHIDRFGNIITTVHSSQLTSPPEAVGIEGEVITSFVRTYAEGSGLVALVGSSGYLEVAEVNGNATTRLGAEIGHRVTVELAGT